MKISRRASLQIAFILDNLLPPILRDWKVLNWLMAKILYKEKHYEFFSFKSEVSTWTEEELSLKYETVAPFFIQRDTDLNQECLAEILVNISGNKILDVGCGTGFLIDKMKQVLPEIEVWGCDINSRQEFAKGVHFHIGSAEDLPFKDNEFDTVVCTHTLEHVRHLNKALEELRRVCYSRLIIVVPMQRPYHFTFDFHIHFFPYPYSFVNTIGPPHNKYLTRVLGGDIYYQEDF